MFPHRGRETDSKIRRSLRQPLGSFLERHPSHWRSATHANAPLTFGVTNGCAALGIVEGSIAEGPTRQAAMVHDKRDDTQHALQIMTDGLPAIGIVAAVLGVIKTMGSIDQPVEVLGAMIGGALVGTFLGVLLSYCIVGPLASKLLEVIEADSKPFLVAKSAIVAYAQHVPVQVAVEIARRMAPSAHAPTFQQLEAALDEAKNELNATPA